MSAADTLPQIPSPGTTVEVDAKWFHERVALLSQINTLRQEVEALETELAWARHRRVRIHVGHWEQAPGGRRR